MSQLVLGIVLVEMLHVTFQLAHRSLDLGIVKVGHRSVRPLVGTHGGRFTQSPRHGEPAHLLHHLLIPALWAGRQTVGIHPLREEIENDPAFRAGEFVDRHRS